MENNNIFTKELIESYCKEWVKNKIDQNFEFREYQLECIINICLNILNKQHRNYIIEAPTGSGKSLINIIAAGVLSDYFDLTSYILVSDLFLWEQYEVFLKKYKKTGIASLKGQTGNYICKLNGEDMKNADCKMSGLSWSSMFNSNIINKYGYECAKTCPYIKARKKAIKSKVCIMTYQLFMFIMNNPQFNTDSKGAPIFAERDILFCDEAHNIPEIVQQQYCATVKLDDFDKLETLYNKIALNELDLFTTDININDISPKLSKYKNSYELIKECKIYWDIWGNQESLKQENIKAMYNYEKIIEAFIPIATKIKSDINEKKLNKEPITKEDINMFKLASWHENYFCRWEDLCDAIKNTGLEYLLKETNISNEDNHISFAFKCTKEDYLIWNYLLKKANYKIFLSATIGGKEAYDVNMGFKFDIDDKKEDELNNSKLEIIPSTFNFEESPIYFLNKFKMSFKEKDISFKHLKTIIYSICSTKFKEQRGMIQTGSYAFAKQLYDDAPFEIKQRMLVYNGSKEKNNMIKLHKISDNTILVGPTLNTGVDLPGDECRFIIIMKVPYPSLADKLVKEKIKLFPLWYNSTTSNEIIQGIGRGVRYNNDWCVTYILDACFWNLYRSTIDQYPEELQNRIKII